MFLSPANRQNKNILKQLHYEFSTFFWKSNNLMNEFDFLLGKIL